MEKSNLKLLERQINRLISEKMESEGLLVLNEIRFNLCELDIVLFDPRTLKLINIEIKRSNWRELLFQSIRGKLYCHFSIAAMPVSMQRNLIIDDFSRHGIGVCFYEEKDDEIKLLKYMEPTVSTVTNKFFKQKLYQQFYLKYGNEIL